MFNMKHLNQLTVLMNTAQFLEIYKDIEKYKLNCYSDLFDSLMFKKQYQYPLFEYIYEQVKFNMFELVNIDLQKEEFIRLVNLTSLEQEFNHSLNLYLCENF